MGWEVLLYIYADGWVGWMATLYTYFDGWMGWRVSLACGAQLGCSAPQTPP